jgi:preprotein translocase subunit SecA
MRLFGPQRFGGILNAWPEEEAVAAKLVSRQLENAQKKVEIRNFGIRKDVIKYDDVMDTQRKLIYGERRKVLSGDDLSDTIEAMLDQAVAGVVRAQTSPEVDPDAWDPDGLYQGLRQAVPGVEERISLEELGRIPRSEMEEQLQQIVREAYAERRAEIGPEIMSEIERSILLRVIDMRFMAHINEMEQLYEYIHLRAYAQTDPFIAYQQEAFSFFESLKQAIAEDVTRLLFVAEVAVQQQERASDLQKSRGAQVGAEEEATRKPVAVSKQPGRNAPCPCGSGRKYKKCCMGKDAEPSDGDSGNGDGDGSSPEKRAKKRRRKR